MEKNTVVSFKEILKRKMNHYGQTEAAYDFAVEEFEQQYKKRKPIFIATIPDALLTDAEFDKLRMQLIKTLSVDYYVLIVNTGGKFDFKVLAEKDYKEIDLTKIEETVKQIFKQV